MERPHLVTRSHFFAASDKVLEDLKGAGGKVLRTSFDHTKEEELRSVLADATAAHAAT